VGHVSSAFILGVEDNSRDPKIEPCG